MRRGAARAGGLLALILGLAPACFWEGRSGLDAAAFGSLAPAGVDASGVFVDAGPQGACSSDADQALRESADAEIDAALESCGAGCFSDDDVAGCTADCLAAATGLSAGCAGCYGADTACTIAFCLTDCMQPDSAACRACREASCTEAFEACVDGLPTPDAGVAPDASPLTDAADAGSAADVGVVDSSADAAPLDGAAIAPGACVNSDDMSVLADPGVDVDATVSSCGASCFGQEDVGQCTGDCVASATGLSADCAGCFGADTACTIAFCLAECMQPASPECLECRGASCSADFERCLYGPATTDAGAAPDASQPSDASCCADVEPADLADAAPAPDVAVEDGSTDAAPEDGAVMLQGACLNSADQGVLADPGVDVQAAVSSCSAGCFGQADVARCTADCVASSTGLSADCASCFGGDSACTIAFCLAECTQPDSAPCQTCREQHCTAAFTTCAWGPPMTDAGSAPDVAVEDGSTDAAPEDGAVMVQGACLNSADLTVLADPDVELQATVSSCGAGCFGQGDVAQCTADCVAGATGLSAACAGCFGADTVCTIERCMVECADPASDACLLCRAEMCESAFEACLYGGAGE